MWVGLRAGALEAVRERKVDTGVAVWRAHGANANCMACICMLCYFSGAGCTVLGNGAAFDSRSNQGVEGERGKSMRW